MRLWGIADEPFWPAVNGSWSSPISVCCRLRTSVAKRSSEPPMMAIAVEERRVPVALDDLGADRVHVQPELREDLGLDVRPEVAVRADRPGDLAGRRSRRRRPRAGRRPRSSSKAQPASLSPSVVGSAWTEWVRPIITVAGLGRARPIRTASSRVDVARAAARRPRGAGGPGAVSTTSLLVSPRWRIATLRPDRLGDLADEGDDVVVGRPLDLGDPLDVDPRALSSAARASAGRGRGPPGRERRRARPGASPRSGPASVQIAPISGSV